MTRATSGLVMMANLAVLLATSPPRTESAQASSPAFDLTLVADAPEEINGEVTVDPFFVERGLVRLEVRLTGKLSEALPVTLALYALDAPYDGSGAPTKDPTDVVTVDYVLSIDETLYMSVEGSQAFNLLLVLDGEASFEGTATISVLAEELDKTPPDDAELSVVVFR